MRHLRPILGPFSNSTTLKGLTKFYLMELHEFLILKYEVQLRKPEFSVLKVNCE